jgi:hypothetical protein
MAAKPQVTRKTVHMKKANIFVWAFVMEPKPRPA